MNPGEVTEPRFVAALRTQGKAEYPITSALQCPYSDHHGRIFQSVNQLFDHAKFEHAADIATLEPRQACEQLKEAALRLGKSDKYSNATAGDSLASAVAELSLKSTKELHRSSELASTMAELSLDSAKKPRQPSHSSENNRSANKELCSHVGKDSSRQIPYIIASDRNKPKPQDSRPLPRGTTITSQYSMRQPGLLELQRYDPRYPGLLLQPDSRPISQEQLASEVKSIYAGLTMVETKCIHVDRAHAAAAQDNSDTKLTSDHWQALIALPPYSAP